MTLDNMTGITEGSYTGFCKRQLITCNFVKACNGVCPFEDALKHADKEMADQTVIDHDRDWIPVEERLPSKNQEVLLQCHHNMIVGYWMDGDFDGEKEWRALSGDGWENDCGFPNDVFEPLAWMPLPEPYRKDGE